MKRIIQAIKDELGRCYPTGETAALTRIISTEILDIPQSTFFLKDDVTLTPRQETLFYCTIERLKKHEPIQYIIGYCDFCGLTFKVTPDTLIPRPETSELVEWITEEQKGDKVNILDIGTGSGCIAISLSCKLPGCNIAAWDISSGALAVAEENNRSNGTEVTFSQVDILVYQPQGEMFDIIVSNPPYIKEKEKKSMEANVLDWEPHTALFVPDNDPLLFYRAIAEKALAMLTSGGALYFEINRAHGAETVEMLKSLGYIETELRKDLAGNDRMIKAIRP